ncbi:SH3 domain-containing protein [Synechocystis sp. LKSZ1]|uniref:SH3 domain-containing protein n=1 Tax=Synechocystis sp. LKSZ1 TaxID=3144951 RepID=UPI00336BE082
MRSKLSRSSEPVSRIVYEEEVVVLEKSADGEWVKIWAGVQEGWVLLKNLERM